MHNCVHVVLSNRAQHLQLLGACCESVWVTVVHI